MSKEKTQETNEEIMEAKGAVVVAEPTAVSTEVAVSGVQLDFPFVRIGQGMSQWRTPETRNGKPEEGAFYIGKNKEANYKLAEAGKSDGLYGIILELVYGYKEDRAYVPGNNTPPKRWVVAGNKDDGTPVTDADCLAEAAKEGFSLTPKPTGEVWADSGRPKMRANLARFCYMMMLVPLPDTFESNEFRLYPIGDHLYTTVRFEFDKQYFKQFADIMSNIRSRAEFSFRQSQKKLLAEGKIDKDACDKAIAEYQWSVNGLVGHLYTCPATNRQGIEYTTHVFEKALRDGKPWEFTDKEKEDFTKFLMSVKAGTASIDEIDAGEF